MAGSIAGEALRMSAGRLYILAGGGSGGHLCPGLAVAEQLGELDSAAEVLLLCTQRDIDDKFLSGSDLRHITQPVAPLRWGLRSMVRFWRGWRKSAEVCRKVMTENDVAAVLGLGGFASGPAEMLGHELGVPVGMLNPDALPGKANRWGSKYADRIFLQWEVARGHFGRDAAKCVVTGCPITNERREFAPCTKTAQVAARESLGLSPQKRTLAIVGGSLGGRNVNEAMVELLTKSGDRKLNLDGWQVLHLTGTADRDRVQQAYTEARTDAVVLAFTQRMGAVLAAAELVITRSGGSTLAEISALGVPSILLPYPYHRDNHQWRNGHVLADPGAARMVKDCCNAAETAARLQPVLAELMGSKATRGEMANAARAIGRLDAAKVVAEQLVRMADGGS